jgi:hypothetical protein
MGIRGGNSVKILGLIDYQQKTLTKISDVFHLAIDKRKSVQTPSENPRLHAPYTHPQIKKAASGSL